MKEKVKEVIEEIKGRGDLIKNYHRVSIYFFNTRTINTGIKANIIFEEKGDYLEISINKDIFDGDYSTEIFDAIQEISEYFFCFLGFLCASIDVDSLMCRIDISKFPKFVNNSGRMTNIFLSDSKKSLFIEYNNGDYLDLIYIEKEINRGFFFFYYFDFRDLFGKNLIKILPEKEFDELSKKFFFGKPFTDEDKLRYLAQ